MSRYDLEINRQIRKILVKHWIDLGRLSIRTTMGRVSVRGSLKRIQGMSDELTIPIVENMFNEMRRIREIRRINADLDNWEASGGRWKPKKSMGESLPLPRRPKPRQISTTSINP